MTQPNAPSSDPPDNTRHPLPPQMTPSYRARLAGTKRSRVSPEDVAKQYYGLCDGTPEEQGRAHDLAACLVDPDVARGYMDSVWKLARSWANAAQDRYDVEDLVASTAEEILLALPRPSSRKVATTNWLRFCDRCFQRARQQGGINGRDGYKSISARAVRDAQRQIAALDRPDAEEVLEDEFLDDVVVQDDEHVEDEHVETDHDAPSVDLDEASGDGPDEDEDDSPLQKDGHDRHTVATGMVYALQELSPDTDDATHQWLLAFIEDYLVSYVAEIEDPNRRAVAEAVLTDVPTSRDSKTDCTPLLESLALTRDQINDLKKQERLRFKGALVREAKMSGVVDDDFVRSILERSRSGAAPWK